MSYDNENRELNKMEMNTTAGNGDGGNDTYSSEEVGNGTYHFTPEEMRANGNNTYYSQGNDSINNGNEMNYNSNTTRNNEEGEIRQAASYSYNNNQQENQNQNCISPYIVKLIQECKKQIQDMSVRMASEHRELIDTIHIHGII